MALHSVYTFDFGVLLFDFAVFSISLETPYQIVYEGIFAKSKTETLYAYRCLKLTYQKY